jgi:hypothetical protein
MPAISAVAWDLAEMGRHAATLLLERMRGEAPGVAPMPHASDQVDHPGFLPAITVTQLITFMMAAALRATTRAIKCTVTVV